MVARWIGAAQSREDRSSVDAGKKKRELFQRQCDHDCRDEILYAYAVSHRAARRWSLSASMVQTPDRVELED